MSRGLDFEGTDNVHERRQSDGLLAVASPEAEDPAFGIEYAPVDVNDMLRQRPRWLSQQLEERVTNFIEQHTEFLSHDDPSPLTNTECPICFEGIEEHICMRIIGIEGCTHLIGLECLEALLKSNTINEKECPLCRTAWKLPPPPAGDSARPRGPPPVVEDWPALPHAYHTGILGPALPIPSPTTLGRPWDRPSVSEDFPALSQPSSHEMSDRQMSLQAHLQHQDGLQHQHNPRSGLHHHSPGVLPWLQGLPQPSQGPGSRGHRDGLSDEEQVWQRGLRRGRRK